jgi:hypothetical protein
VLVASLVGLVAMLVVLPEPDTEIAAFDPASIPVAAPPTASAPPPIEPTAEATTSGVPNVGRAATVDAATAETSAPSVEITPTTEMAPPPVISAVAWAGDSVAFELAPAVEAALTAAGLTVNINAAYPGVRLLGPLPERRLTTQVPSRLAAISADTLMIVVSAWDADIDNEDYAVGLRELLELLPPSGRLIVLSAPPTGDDARNVDVDRLAGVAEDVAARSEGRIVYIDASAPWVVPAVRDANGDGVPERKPDLVHVCPAGAASFAAWLTVELDTQFDGLEPADPVSWLSGDWTADGRYDEPIGACAPM